MYIARSRTDPHGDQGGLSYQSADAARHHCDTMNELREHWPDGLWNTEFWKSKPEEWFYYEQEIKDAQP